MGHISLVPLFCSRLHNVTVWCYIIFIAVAAIHKSVWKLFENRKLQAKGQSFRRNWAGPALKGEKEKMELCKALTCNENSAWEQRHSLILTRQFKAFFKQLHLVKSPSATLKRRHALIFSKYLLLGVFLSILLISVKSRKQGRKSVISNLI